MAEAIDVIIVALCAWTALVYVGLARHLLLHAQLYVPEGEEVQQRGSRTGAVVAHTLIAGLFAAVALQPLDACSWSSPCRRHPAWGTDIPPRVAGGLAALGYIISWGTIALGPPPRGIVNTREPWYKLVGNYIGGLLVQGGLIVFFTSTIPPDDTLGIVLLIAFLVATVALNRVSKWVQFRVAEVRTKEEWHVAEVRSKEGPSPPVVGAPSGAPAADPEVCAAQDVVPEFQFKFTKEMANDRLRTPLRCMAVLIYAQVAIFVVYMLSRLSWFA